MNSSVPAGWYPDANGQMRYWDGDKWGDLAQPAPPAPPSPSPYSTAPLPRVGPAAAAGVPWYRRARYVVPLAVIAGLIVIGGIASALGSSSKHPAASTAVVSSSSAASSATSATTSAPEPTVTVTSTVVPQAPAPVTTTGGGGSFLMPNEVGQVLQDAQDDIQRVSGDPILFSHSHDLRGSRFQILDRDWKVCTQNVPPKTRVSATGHIDFGVVKLSETCP